MPLRVVRAAIRLPGTDCEGERGEREIERERERERESERERGERDETKRVPVAPSGNVNSNKNAILPILGYLKADDLKTVSEDRVGHRR